MFGWLARPGRMVKMSAEASTCLIPYRASNSGVATYSVPEKLLFCLSCCSSVALTVSSVSTEVACTDPAKPSTCWRSAVSWR
jgi:hypothetical protein